MFFIFFEYEDEGGDSIKAQMFAFETKERAMKVWEENLQSPRTLEMRLVEGKVLNSYHIWGRESSLIDNERALSNDELQKSALEDVPDGDKEKI